MEQALPECLARAQREIRRTLPPHVGVLSSLLCRLLPFPQESGLADSAVSERRAGRIHLSSITMDPIPPANLPEPGFYYHYKHDHEGPEEKYAYELMGIGHHTEEDCRPEDSFLAVYRPLYEEALVYRLSRMYDIRPLSMFMETVVKEGRETPRFTVKDRSGILPKSAFQPERITSCLKSAPSAFDGSSLRGTIFNTSRIRSRTLGAGSSVRERIFIL